MVPAPTLVTIMCGSSMDVHHPDDLNGADDSDVVGAVEGPLVRPS
ncbi:hypothetical protein ACH4S8_41460 [Streptomyces sp. NPDC021080]